MFMLVGWSRDVFGAIDVGAGAGHDGSSQSYLGLWRERTYKLNVLIIELYYIAGVLKILLDVTFVCDIMWIYVCTRMYVLEDCNINPGRERS